MKHDEAIGPVDPSILRDHGDDEKVRRIWQQIEPDLPLAPRRRERPWLWVPAAALALFGSGVIVGARWFAAAPVPIAAVSAEPAQVAEPAAAPTVVERAVQEPEKQPPRAAVRRSKPARAKPEVIPPTVTEPAPPPVIAVVEEDPGPPLWQRLADDGYYHEALVAIEDAGGFDAVLHQSTAEQLMLLQDVARATSQRERAILALRQVVSQHGSDPNAPVAAWMLGNELAKAGDRDGAAQAFAMYRALSPQGDFAEDALAREFEVAIEQGNVEHARRLAEQYAKDFPDGPRLAEIRAQLEGVSRSSAGDAVPDNAASESAEESVFESIDPALDSPGGPSR